MIPSPPLMPRGSGGVLGSVTVPQQQTPSSVHPLAYANYAMGSPQVGFFFRVEPPTILYLIYVWCLFWCLLFTFRCRVGCHIHLWGLNLWGFHLCNPLEFTHGRHMCNMVKVIGPHLVCIEWLFPLLPWVGGAFCYSFSCALTIWWGIQPWGLHRESPDPSAFPT